MREIKFRAWLFDKKIMAYSDKENSLYAIDKIIFMTNTIIFSDNDPVLSGPYFARAFYYEISDKNVKLMQYTGLKDKNGMEIYEGDIVLGQSKYFSSYKFCIEWQFFYGAVHETTDQGPGFNFSTYCPEELEVIGNKYENESLIEEFNLNKGEF